MVNGITRSQNRENKEKTTRMLRTHNKNVPKKINKKNIRDGYKKKEKKRKTQKDVARTNRGI